MHRFNHAKREKAWCSKTGESVPGYCTNTLRGASAKCPVIRQQIGTLQIYGNSPKLVRGRIESFPTIAHIGYANCSNSLKCDYAIALTRERFMYVKRLVCVVDIMV